MVNADAVSNIMENAQKIINICNRLQPINLQYRTSVFVFEQTKLLERMLLVSYQKNKLIQPFYLRSQCIENHILSDENISEFGEIISMDDNTIQLRLPFLAHKRNGDKMITDIVHTIFAKAIAEGRHIPQMIHHTIDFTHIYPTDYKDYTLFDNDNYNIRGVINIIVIYIGSSDSGLNSWHTHKTILSDKYEMGTYITIRRRDKNSIFAR